MGSLALSGCLHPDQKEPIFRDEILQGPKKKKENRVRWGRRRKEGMGEKSKKEEKGRRGRMGEGD